MKSVRIGFGISEDQEKVLQLLSEKRKNFDIVKKYLYQTATSGIGKTNIFEIEFCQRNLEKIQSQLNEKHSEIQGTLLHAIIDSRSEITSYLKKLDCLHKWSSDFSSWQSAVEAKRKELLNYEKWQLSNTLRFADLENPDHILKDFVVIHSRDLLQNLDVNALSCLVSRHSSNQELIEEKISIKPISPSNSSDEKRLYISRKINDYITKRKQKGEYITSFWGLNYGFPKTIKIGAAEWLLDKVQIGRIISADDWENLNKLYRKALQQGDLGELFKEFNQLLKDEIRAIDDYTEREYQHTGLI